MKKESGISAAFFFVENKNKQKQFKNKQKSYIMKTDTNKRVWGNIKYGETYMGFRASCTAA
ncbi:hypothetical protein D3Z17_16430 [Bacillus subtilis]|nr:hypothetical protein CD007_15725 [Bacillus subtilis]AXF34410.1 hypothetical protein DS740_16925 [Bacillus sp. DM2]QAT76093.1 hypothetical protein D9C22_16760 [Bacillus sp. WR11]AYF12581.1 hypothetical protein D3Z17_16430 [Bacillus subtilis]PWI60338.1 hypothetical protein DCS65_16635 [Bacillus subtilis]